MSKSVVGQTGQTAADRAARRTLLQRRRRVWRSLVLFVVVTAVMVLVSMAQRDYQSVRTCRQRLEYTCAELQKLLERGDKAPQSLPLPRADGGRESAGVNGGVDDDAYFTLRARYFYNARYGRAAAREKRVGVCCCEQPHRLYLRADGRHVIVFDGQRYDLIWMAEQEFRRQAAELGLHVPDGR